jgi:hypothetical protein
MTANRNKLYLTLFIACLAGYIWLYYSLTVNIGQNKSIEVCLIKHLTNIPCPSCGSTRSVISLTKGHFIDAFNLNPLGYVVAIILFLAPFWMILDFIMRKDSLFAFYKKVETYLKKPSYSFPLIALMIINWIWNLTKGL